MKQHTDLTSIGELMECEDYKEVNRYLEGKNKGKWVLLSINFGLQKCYGVQTERIVQYDKPIRLYVIGKLRED
jgi:hypothetical protein